MSRFVFVDQRVVGQQALMAGLGEDDSQWIAVDDRTDALGQMQRALAQASGVRSIRILAHGRPGALTFGAGEITAETLARHSDAAALIGRALGADGDIQIYGCEVGRGAAGRDFVAALGAAFGVPIAASSTPVGHADLGGDWRLDVGAVRTKALAVPQWRGLLGLTVTPVPVAYPGRTSGELRNAKAFAAIRADGSLVTWGDPSYGGNSSAVAAQLDGTNDVVQVFSTESAFAALRADGSVVTWGDSSYGGNSSTVAARLDGTIDVVQVLSTRYAFAALRADGSVVTWGDWSYGGNSSAVAAQLDGTNDVVQVSSTEAAFAALRADGSVVTWGHSSYGGDSFPVAAQLDGTIDVVQVFSTRYAFAALRSDGSVVTWGNSNYGGNSSAVAAQLDGTIDVVQVFSTAGAFAALRADRSVVTWGSSSYGGNSSAVAAQLDGTNDVVQVFSTESAFAALRADGSVVTWGDSSRGGNSLAVAAQLDGTNEVVQVFSTERAFAALRADGSVVTWGDSSYGGNSSALATQLDGTNDVVQLFSTAGAFAALRADGLLVTWGAADSGGESSSLAGSLIHVVALANPFTQDIYTATHWVDGTTGNDSLVGTAADDTLNGGLGADTLEGLAGNDGYVVDSLADLVIEAVDGGYDSVAVALGAAGTYVLPANVEIAHLTTSTPGMRIDGNALGNRLVGNSHDDVLAGLAGDDSLWGSGGSDTLLGGEGNDLLFGDAGADSLDGGEGADSLDGGAGADTLGGGDGSDVYTVNDGGDQVIEAAAGSGIDTVLSYLGAYTLPANVEEGRLRTSGLSSLAGNSQNNILYAGEGNNTLFGDGGNDTVSWGDTVSTAGVVASLLSGIATGASGNDSFSGFENLHGSAGNDRLTGDAGDNMLAGGAGNDTLDGGAGDDTLDGGDGSDTYTVDSASDLVVEANAAVAGGVDLVQSALAAYTLSANTENGLILASGAANLTGNDASNVLTGGAGNNALAGAGGNDSLIGGAGDDTLDGGTGADSLTGGDGSDTYSVDDAADLVVETNSAVAGGVDRVHSTLAAYTLGANVENGLIIASGAADLTGNGLGNVLTGGAGNNTLAGAGGNDSLIGAAGDDTLDGGTGTDTLDGGDGSDTYTVDSTSDLVVETNGSTAGGVDLVQSLASAYTLATNVENGLILASGAANLTGNDGSNVLTGGAGNNALAGAGGNDGLIGGAGNDTLDGGAGDDTLDGGDGSDTYTVDSASDLVVETNATVAGGVDLVLSLAAAHTLSANVENGRIVATGVANLSGNDADNLLFAGIGDNVIAGHDGIDTLSWADGAVIGSGVNASLATGTASGGSGSDTFTGIENLIGSASDDVLAGDEDGNRLDGGAGNDVLDGAAGADSLSGGGGWDTYYVDDVGDQVLESGATSSEIDLVCSFLSAYVLPANVEDGLILADGPANLTGNALANFLVGNTEANALDGGAGIDTLTGGDGSDTYTVDHLRDQVIETDADPISGGVDPVYSLLPGYTLPANVESGSILATGTANLTGNTFDNLLTGGIGNNLLAGAAGNDTLLGGGGADTLNGGTGADSLSGGDGADVYVVDDVGDQISETNGDPVSGGSDTVHSWLSAFSLPGNVENGRILVNTAANLVGNDLDNLVYAGTGDNTISGGAGVDTLSWLYGVSGGLGVTASLTSGTASGGSGNDIFIGIEHLTGSGNSDSLGGDGNANKLNGAGGSDTLDGGAGADTLIGGDGSDLYLIDHAGDQVSESNADPVTGGSDTVSSSLAAYTLVANVENGLLLAGGANLTGNALNNLLTGNGSANTLNGLTGADTLIGGDGSDSYYVDDAGDSVSETNVDPASGGTDQVFSYLAAYTLGANVENGRILAAGAASLTGNALDNLLYAGTGNNLLDGAGGNDTVSYLYGASSGVTVSLAIATPQATGGSGSDTLIAIENLSGSTYDDTLTGDATANRLTGAQGNDFLNGGAGNDTLDGGTGNDRLWGGSGADSLVGGDGSDFYYVDDAGDSVSETNANSTTGGTDQVLTYLASTTLGANIENGRILATGAASLIGNALDNLLEAGTGANLLDGAIGNDTVSYLYGASSGVSVSLAIAGAQATGGSGSDTLIAIEHLSGSNHDDALTGDANANRLSGAQGNDFLNGGAGDDTLDGGAGNDSLWGGTGADSLVGGDGSDSYYVDNAGDSVSETNANPSTGGIDVVYSSLGAYTLGANIENGRILATGAANLSGNALDNLLYAGTGNNLLDGAGGNDTVSYLYGASSGVSVSLAVAGAQATGGSGSDTLISIEHLVGSSHADTLSGDGLANRLEGGNGNDTLAGGAGNDTLLGGVGNDSLVGGLGADTFRFDTLPNAATNRDTIGDFNVLDDTIELENLIFTSLPNGPLAAGSFRSGAGFTAAADADDYLIYDTTSGALYYDANGNTGAAAVQIASLAAGLALTSLDFLVT